MLYFLISVNWYSAIGKPGTPTESGPSNIVLCSVSKIMLLFETTSPQDDFVLEVNTSENLPPSL